MLFNEIDLLMDIAEYKNTGKIPTTIHCSVNTAYAWQGQLNSKYPLIHKITDVNIVGWYLGIPVKVKSSMVDGIFEIV